MSPIELFGEARQETGRGDTAGRPPADVGHVGEIAAQLFLIVFPQRHPPDTVVGNVACVYQLVGKVIRVGIHARRNVAQRDDTGTRQRGDVDHCAGLIAFSVG